jgi:hypothetical protein
MSILRTAPWVLVLPALAACDPPADHHDGSGAGDEITITDLQDDRAAAHPAPGDRITVSDVVVIAVDDYDEDGAGRVGSLWISEPGGGAFSGVQLFNPSIVPARARLFPGDIVRAVGTVDEFVLLDDAGNPEDPDGTLTELSDVSVTKIGETLPLEPIPVLEADFADPQDAERYEGCLIRIDNVRIRTGYDSYGEATTEGQMAIATDLYEIPGLAPGSRYHSITGVVTYFFGYSLLPRGPDDVVE